MYLRAGIIARERRRYVYQHVRVSYPRSASAHDRLQPVLDGVQLTAAPLGPRRISLVSSVVALTVLVACVQFVVARGFGDPDGYYHVAMAQLFGKGTSGPAFPWLPYTLLGQHFSDQHYLYHGLLDLFLRVPHGAQWSVVAIFLAMLVVLARLLRDMGVPLVPLWLAVFTLGSSELLFRMNLVRPSVLGILLVTGVGAALYRRRLGWLFCLSLVFPLVYGGFIVLPLVVGVWELVRMAYGAARFPSATVLCLLGLGLGVALHPHPWEYVRYLYTQVFLASVGSPEALNAGIEWRPYGVGPFVRTNMLMLAVWMIGIVVLISEATRENRDQSTPLVSTWLLVTSAVFCAFALVSRRFVEYWALFALLMSAWVLAPSMRRVSWSVTGTMGRSRRPVAVLGAVAVCVAIFLAGWNLDTVFAYYSAVPRYDLFHGAGQLLRSHAGANQIVVNTQWDQFPSLFLWNPASAYIAGLDPRFLSARDPRRCWLWRQVADDRVAAMPARELHRIVRDEFGAGFIVIEQVRNPRLLELLDTPEGEQYFAKVFEDRGILIYRAR